MRIDFENIAFAHPRGWFFGGGWCTKNSSGRAEPERHPLNRKRAFCQLETVSLACYHKLGKSMHRALFQQGILGHRKQSRLGFSLVELSIVILVLSILFTVMFGVFFGAAKITSMSSPSTQARQQALLTLEMMRSSINQTFYNRDIERLVFFGKEVGGGETRKDRLTFACVNSGADALGVPAVREVSFYVKEDPGGETGTLYRREDQMVDKKPGEGGSHYPVLKNVVSLKFRYTLTGREWKESWNSKEVRRIPRLVQIQIRVKIGDRTQKFETLAYPGLYMN